VPKGSERNEYQHADYTFFFAHVRYMEQRLGHLQLFLSEKTLFYPTGGTYKYFVSLPVFHCTDDYSL
jgi:hypothetical protein